LVGQLLPHPFLLVGAQTSAMAQQRSIDLICDERIGEQRMKRTHERE
jgi:hypothetical protein